MKFRTPIDIPTAPFQINPGDRMLFVGSCFAERMGRRFADECFPTVINPFGTMYNPASILHTIEKTEGQFDIAVLTLGTSRVYIEKATGEIVDNCQKRPQRLFDERELSIDECADYIQKAIGLLRQANPHIHIILTVSPIRYSKYGFHESQLSKAKLLLATDIIVHRSEASLSIVHYPFSISEAQRSATIVYFPAYEIVMDELRDYRFYAVDMLHPSEQAVDYIWERFDDTFFSAATRQYLNEWRPIKEALAHRPFHPDSPEYQAFRQKTLERAKAFMEKVKK